MSASVGQSVIYFPLLIIQTFELLQEKEKKKVLIWLFKMYLLQIFIFKFHKYLCLQ